MNKYGIDNVRGGPWCQIDISGSLSEIQQILDSGSDKCYKWGSEGHFVKDCSGTKRTKKTTKKLPKIMCGRCDRMGHTEDSCYAKTYDNGSLIIEEEVWS